MYQDLHGKNAVITGSTSGIGLGFAKGLAQAGVNIMLNGFGVPEQIEALRQDIEQLGVQAYYSPADMTDPVQIRTLIEMTEKKLGSIDILINNAGIQKVAPIEKFPDDKWNDIIAINLTAAFHMIKQALPGMKQRGFGRIINLASVHGLVASPFKSAYVAAKHGLIGLTKTVALEVALEGITCNAICPGYVETPLVQNQIMDTAKARGISVEEVKTEVMLKAQPTKEFVTFDQLNGLLLYLCSTHGAGVNGAGLPVDGGWTAQ
ncbi:MAG: 3-hydroxybutyrate dehydrogenase [bacterium]